MKIVIVGKLLWDAVTVTRLRLSSTSLITFMKQHNFLLYSSNQKIIGLLLFMKTRFHKHNTEVQPQTPLAGTS